MRSLREVFNLFGDNLKQQKLFLCWMDFSKVPSKLLSCPMCLVSYDKLTMFFPAVGLGVKLGAANISVPVRFSVPV